MVFGDVSGDCVGQMLVFSILWSLCQISKRTRDKLTNTLRMLDGGTTTGPSITCPLPKTRYLVHLLAFRYDNAMRAATQAGWRNSTVVGLRRLVLPLILGLLLTLAVEKLASWATAEDTAQSVNTGEHFLPPYGSARDRFGFDSGSLSGYDVAQLHAGWYSNWGANLTPDHPDQLVYVQLIRFYEGSDPHDPSQVTVRPDKATIAQIAAAHPGSLWLMSNEPDSLYQGDPILPEVYAIVYHDYHTYIKGLDPTALFANAGIVQPTPCRLEYLDIVWDTYLESYSETLPVDVWNIHAFTLREVYGSWGASTPPGVDPSCGIEYTVDEADDIELLFNNIAAMRTWMAEKGQKDKPLIITEYGVLWPQWFAPQFTPERVSHFMTQTFDLFLHSTDLDIGYPADDYRLVQAWAWYSLSDDQLYNGYLFHSDSKTLSAMGEAYGAYTASLSDGVYTDLSARLTAGWPDHTPALASADTAGQISLTISLTGNIGNLGKLPAADISARLEILSNNLVTTAPGWDGPYAAPARFEGVTALPPLTLTLATQGRYELHLSLDPDNQFDEPREWNNIATTIVDLRPDLEPLDLDYRLTVPFTQNGTLVSTVTVRNQGIWPSPAVSGTVYLQAMMADTLGVSEEFSVPPINIEDQARIEITLSWPVPDHDLYQLKVVLDEDSELDEQREDNNSYELLIPVAVSADVMPNVTTVLTSASGAMGFVFPSGTVTMPTEISLIPLWPGDWETGVLKPSAVAFSLTAKRDDQPVPLTFAQPVSVTLHYDESDVSGLEPTHLRLFVQGAGEQWYDAFCRSYQRHPDEDRLALAICGTGRFVFGNRYDQLFPLLLTALETLAQSRYSMLDIVPQAQWVLEPKDD